MDIAIGMTCVWEKSMIGCLLLILNLMPWCNVQAQEKNQTLPWLVKPVPSVVEVEPQTDFPIVRGLDLKALITKPDYSRTSSASATIYFDQTQYAYFPKLMQNDPAFKAGWKRLVRLARAMLKDDGLGVLKDVKPERYVYKLGGRLLNTALYYRMTGDPEAGKFLKAITLDTANRPMSFWMHRALRRYKDDWPLGQLETAILARGMSVALVWGHDLYSKSERLTIVNALRDKGLYPMLRFLETKERHNNFIPAIASGAMVAAVALNDSLAREHSLIQLNKWGALVEDDGSYGEQVDYFNYACVNFAKGHMVLGQKHLLELGKKLPQLHGSMAWQLAHYSFDAKANAIRLNFGDDDYRGGPPNRLTTQFLTMATGNGLGTWLLENFYGKKLQDDAYAMIAKIVLAGVDFPAEVSPQNLSTTLGYQNGIGITRSGWTMDQDTVLALRSGGGNRTQYSHDAPNRNAVAMMFHGDYLLVEPGRSSYRSKVRKSYDLKTVHHNTITFSGKSQPRTRVAKLLAAKSINANLSLLISEAAQSYRIKPKHARRSVYHLRDMDLFVIWDYVELSESKTVQANWHFGNEAMKSRLSQLSDNHWQLAKPRTQLDYWVFADQPTVSTQREGIMHFDYSYFPGDPNEGQWGNAFELQVASQKKVKQMSMFSVFVPQLKQSAVAVNVSLKTMPNQTVRLSIQKGGQTKELLFNKKAFDIISQYALNINGINIDVSGKVLNDQ